MPPGDDSGFEAFRLVFPPRHEGRVLALLQDLETTGWEVIAESDDGIEARAYFPGRPGPSRLSSLRQRLADLAQVEPDHVPDVDWVARFREGFSGFSVDRFRVVPLWEAADSDRGEWDLLIDPGRAFGTGTHETTRLCLLAMVDLAAEAPLGRVADIGAGTGILAVAASRLGASTAVALDLDPDAVLSARHHSRLNATPIPIVRGDGCDALRPASFDLLLANLSATLLTHRLPQLLSLLVPEGRGVISGLLSGEVPELLPLLDPGFDVGERRLGEWSALLLRRGHP